MHKKMLGDTIHRLRKEKGLSQSELGEAVGVSNKAVSKWETHDANPDISLLPLLAKTLGVTADELLTDIRAEKGDPGPRAARVFGVEGTVIDTPETYEFVSDGKTGKGLPYLHIHYGRHINAINTRARGVVAIGNNAKGIVSIGLVSAGVVSIGLLSLGLLAFGVLTLGVVAASSIAFGGVAVGAIAVGVVAVGAVAVGCVAVGAVAVGFHAHTTAMGQAFGRHIFIHGL